MAGKKYQAAKKLIDKSKSYNLIDAIELVKKTSTSKFDGSIDVAIKLNLDTTKAEQQLRGTIALPHYYGKLPRILALAENITSAEAKKAGADYFGDTDMINKIKEGWLDFDVIITTPKLMVELSKLGKILGPKGLMPNPKLGTVSPNIVKVIEEFKKGKSKYRTDTYGNIHMIVGKVSAPTKDIAENVKSLIEFLNSKRPSTVKGEYIQKIYLSATMGPSVKVVL